MADRETAAGSQISSYKYAGAEELQVRLDTSQELREVDLFMRGKIIRTELNEETGRTYSILGDAGKALCNEEGRQMILMWLRLHINKVAIMGNMPTVKDFNEKMAEIYEHFADEMVLNCTRWEIADYNLHMMITGLMDLIEFALSRTIENLERDGYGSKEKVTERNVTEQKGLRLGGKQ